MSVAGFFTRGLTFMTAVIGYFFYNPDMQPLPIDHTLPQLLDTLRSHSSLVLVAPPGAGKTTRVPAALIRANILPNAAPNIIMLQPRRVAARASAQRIAEENNWQLGQQVGYHIRFEKRYTPQTRIRVLTEAILTRILLDDPYLEGIGCVILDEFHERNIHTDLAIAFLREVQQTVRPDLKLIVMSATLDAEPVAAFLNDAPIIVSEGRTFQIDIAYRGARDVRIEDHVANVVDEALQQDGRGDILVFLPGIGEIERTRRALSRLTRNHIQVLPLHGSLSSEEQQLALRLAPTGTRKIILATNIAETSLTIDGVRTVIDSGLARVASFDPDRGMDRLDLARISQASATQRAGRAGRQGPGSAYRLWPEIEQKHLALFNASEIQRIDLAPTLLALHAWGAKDARKFPWFESPAEELIIAGEQLLKLLGALEGGTLTDLGRQMQRLPIHPRIARLLIAAAGTRLLNDAITLAAILSDDGRAQPRGGSSDPLAFIHSPPPHLSRIRDQLLNIMKSITSPKSSDRAAKDKAAASLPQLLLPAYPDRIAKRRGNDPNAAVMVNGTTGTVGARLAPESLTPALAASPLFLALDVHHDPRNRQAEAIVRSAIPIEESWLEQLFPTAIHTDNCLEFDPIKQKVIAFTRRFFYDLLLQEDPHGKVDPAQSGPILAAALAPRASELFLQNNNANQLLARTSLVRHYIWEVSGTAWPAFDDVQLRELLTEACSRKRTVTELTESDALPHTLCNALPYPLDRQLDQLAPETIEVPTGSKIKIAYTLPSNPLAVPPAPILAVRLQELFGLLETPRIVNGRVPLLLHLLSPGYKPIQITSDLRSFWSSAYFEVRKDLRTRYPKHKWPEDPLTATPEAKGRPRR